MPAKKKSGGACSPGGLFYGFPGPKCSLCCLVFSFFGILVLVVLGVLLEKPYQKAEGESLVYDGEARSSASTAYISAAVYAAFVLACGARAIYIFKFRPPQKEDEEGLNQE